MEELATMTVDNSGPSLISFVVVAEDTTLPTYAAACAGLSMFKATVNNWKATATASDITAGRCVIAIDAANDAVTGAAATDVNKLGAESMTAALTFD